MKNIILVGVGQLGSRHLQALSLLDTCHVINVVDPSEDSLRNAQQRYGEVECGAPHVVRYLSSLDEITEKNIDYVVISTNANIRFQVLKSLIKNFKIKNMLFEKVLFQEIDLYAQANSMLKDLEVNAWVNCPRRMYPFYQRLKNKYLKADLPIHLSYSGGEWVGLACNTIHYLDILNFLSGEMLSQVNVSGLNEDIVESKRNGFVEFTGELVCSFSNGSVLSFNSIKGSDKKAVTKISQEGLDLYLNEISGDYKIYNDGVLAEDGIMDVPYQSRLTNKVVNLIEQTGDCGLINFQTSISLHKPFIKALLDFYNQKNGLNEQSLPIT